MLPVVPVFVGTVLLVALFWAGHAGVKDAVGRSNLLAEAEMQGALAVVADDAAPALERTKLLLTEAGEASLYPAVVSTAEDIDRPQSERLDSLVGLFAARRHEIQHTAELRFLWFSGIGLALVIAGAAGGIFVWRRRWTGRWTRVSRLSDEVSTMARAPLDARFEPSGIDDEVGRIEAILATVAPQLADTLIHQQRLSLMGEQVAYVAHDIRSPLGAIIMSIQMLPDDAADDGIRDFLRGEAERATALADELRSFAKRSDQVTQCDIEAELRATAWAVRHRAAQRGVTLDFVPGAPVPLDARPNEVRQVLVNLLENGVDAAAGSATSMVRVSVHVHGSEARIAVEDSGPGIPPGERQRLFESFYTTKSDGTGMGLAICKRIVESAGGTIEASASADLGGAQFDVRLPLARTTPELLPDLTSIER